MTLLADTPYGKFMYFGSDCIGQSAARCEFWDPHMRPFLDAVPPGGVFVDVGASIGFFTVYMARRGVLVSAFEPSREVFDLLSENVKLNGVSDSVSLECVALYDKDVELWLERKWNQYPTLPDGRIDYENTSNSAVLCLVPKGSGVEPCHAYGKFVGRTFDSYDMRRVDFLKIDTQGCDLRVLLGARETIRRCRPVVCFENEPVLTVYHGDSWEGFLSFFSEMGYEPPTFIGGVDFITRPSESVARG